MRATAPALASALLLVGCGVPTEEPTPEELAVYGAAQAADFPALVSKDCAEVVQFYLEELGGREWAVAALAWDDPAIDAARLEAVFGSYGELQLAWTEPSVEGAAGSLYCTISGKLTDAQDPAKPPVEGTLELKRVNDVPGATPDQLRWTLRSSTFVETLERSDGGKP